MPIDVSMQYRGHNSYRLQVNERYLSAPFAVENMSFITHSFWAMASSTLTPDIRARTRLYDSDGLLITILSHQFAVPTLWDFVELSFAVPSNAHHAQLEFVAGANGFWFVEPKSEAGQTATPYNINYAGQLSKISPTGAYFGLLHANQILLTGSLADPGQTLDGEILKISNKQISLENTLTQKTTKIDSRGIYTGEIEADNITTGTLKSANGHSSLNMANGTFSFGNGALTWSGDELTITGRLRSRLSAGKPTRVDIQDGKIELVNSSGNMIGQIVNWNASILEGLNVNTGFNSKYLSFGKIQHDGGLIVDYFINHGENPLGREERHVFIGGGYFSQKLTVEGDIRTSNNLLAAQLRTDSIRGSDGRQHFLFGSNFTRIYDQNQNIRLHILSNGEEIVAPGGQQVFFRSGSTTQIESTGGNKLGVDSGGAFQVKSGVKTYL